MWSGGLSVQGRPIRWSVTRVSLCAVWSSGLSVQGFSQESYDRLLDVSSSFLEAVQATAPRRVE